MKDKDGFDIKCIFSDWAIIDDRDNKDFICTRFERFNTGHHICFCDEWCREYKPEIKEEVSERK